MDEAGKDAARNRRDPEQPELLERPAADEDRRTRAARRIDRRVRHRNADQMDQREREPIARPAKPTGARLCVVPRMTMRNMNVITTSQTSAAAVNSRRANVRRSRWRQSPLASWIALAAGNHVQYAGADDAAEHLRHDVRDEQFSRKAASAQRPTDTAGLKWPPEIGPSAYAP